MCKLSCSTCIRGPYKCVMSPQVSLQPQGQSSSLPLHSKDVPLMDIFLVAGGTHDHGLVNNHLEKRGHACKLCRNGDVSLHSITNGGLLAEWQHSDGATHYCAAIAFSGDKEVCALASAGGFTMCATPWLRRKGAVLSQYTCPEV